MFTVSLSYIQRHDITNTGNVMIMRSNELRSFNSRNDAVDYAKGYRSRLTPKETLYITSNNKTVHVVSKTSEWIY